MPHIYIYIYIYIPRERERDHVLCLLYMLLFVVLASLRVCSFDCCLICCRYSSYKSCCRARRGAAGAR